MVRIANWGNYPVVDASLESFDAPDDVLARLSATGQLTLRGMGRSYGDASLGPHIASSLRHNHMLAFDSDTGILHCQAGVTLQEILEVFIPRGWFLPVTPGTKFVTVGGAIAADVHGKNHHCDGSYSRHIRFIDLLMADGRVVRCGPSEEPDLFAATCGGMGMTGTILSAAFPLRPVASAYIRQETLHAPDLDAIMDRFDASGGWTYSVAWIDCLARGRNLGRSILMRGESAEPAALSAGRRHDPLALPRRGTRNVPVNFPSFALNRWSVSAFNALYYRGQRWKKGERIVDCDSFFYPLDSIHDWNRIYGRAGFVQYQCVIPLANSRAGLREILERIGRSGRGSFLAVLKLFGPQDGLLAFPMEGYTLALDFPVRDGLLPFLDELDAVVLSHGGRIYLAKDARMSRETFEQGYPNRDRFLDIVDRWNPGRPFRSNLTDRLGLT